MKNERLIKFIIVGLLLLVVLWFGFRPLFTGTSFRNYIKTGRADLHFEDNEYAAIVVGSDPEGIASALASARTGLKTLLITQDADLGGYLKKSMISEMKPQYGKIQGEKVPLNQGIYEEIFGSFTMGFSGEDYEKAVKKLADAEESLDILYNSSVTKAEVENGTVKGIYVSGPEGARYFKARNFIDATWDGQLLILCGTPYTKGSADVGLPDFYAPLEFNFKISGVDTGALKKSQKATGFIDEFKLALLAYRKSDPDTKIVSPSFIILNNGDLVISGLQVFNINVEDAKAVEAAYQEAEDEARLLTAFLKTTLVAFKNCTYKEGPEAFFIPEYRHFEGLYRLTVSDILENRDFKDKIALCSQAVDASRYIDRNIEYIVAKPLVYSIPLGSVVPSNLQNVLMTGAKASFSSLAATSAGSIPARITVGESAGLISAYSFIHEISPALLAGGSEKELKALTGYLGRGGVKISDFSESLLIPDTDQKLTDHWAFGYIRTLAEYGLISGGEENNFKLDYKASQELLTVLIRNVIVKMAPDAYNLDLDKVLKSYEEKKELKGEIAAAIVLDTLSIPYEKDKATETLKQKAGFPVGLTDRLKPAEPVTMDVVYGLAVETAQKIKK